MHFRLSRVVSNCPFIRQNARGIGIYSNPNPHGNLWKRFNFRHIYDLVVHLYHLLTVLNIYMPFHYMTFNYRKFDQLTFDRKNCVVDVNVKQGPMLCCLLHTCHLDSLID